MPLLGMAFKCIAPKEFGGCLKDEPCAGLQECREAVHSVEDKLWQQVVDLYTAGRITKEQLNDPDIDMISVITEKELLD